MNEQTPNTLPNDHPPEVDTLIVPRTSDLGDGFVVRRALPSPERRMVGPFVFFDQMGPIVLSAGRGMDVRPHPHIGLATVTYLFEGEILHRDSLGSVQPIRAGEVNWMTAGKGIVHSERTPPQVRLGESHLFGIQLWVALPKQHEEADPSFTHHANTALPMIEGDGAQLRLILGSLFGSQSPVQTLSAMFYADLTLQPGAEIELAAEHAERAAYIVQGTLELGKHSSPIESSRLIVFRSGEKVRLSASTSPVRLVLLGGEPLEGPRHVWWNFVSSSPERIEAAKADWRAGRFSSVPGETEFIPLPERS